MRANGISVTFTGYRIPGEGAAHRWFKMAGMRKHLRAAFGHDMIGTFNVKAPPRAIAEMLKLPPAIRSRIAHIWAKYYRCTVKQGKRSQKGHILITCDPGFQSHPPLDHVEILTHISLPEEFKTGRLEVVVEAG